MPDAHRAVATEIPLSLGQQALWLACQMDPRNPAYHVNVPIRIRSEIDRTALRRAFQRIVDRHAPLRTSFPARDGAPVQRVEEPSELDFEAFPAGEWTPEARTRWLLETAYAPFDLERGPAFRVRLLSGAPEDHLLLVSAHHLVTDLWSMGLLLEELAALYPAACRGLDADLPPLAREYGDFVAWQQESAEGPEGDRHWSYWKETLDGAWPPLEIPTDRPRPRVQTYSGAELRFEIPSDLVARLHDRARAEKVTRFSLFLAAYQILLHRYSAQARVLVGSPFSGRSRPEFEGIIGYVVNPLVLGADFTDDPTARELVRRTQEQVVGGLEHQDFPFPLLVERLRPARDPRRSPLFQAMFSYEGSHRADPTGPSSLLFGEGTRRTIAGLDLELLSLESKGSQFDLTLTLQEGTDRLLASLEYNTDLFERSSVERMARHYRVLLERLASDPDVRVSAIPMLAEEERRRVSRELSGALVPAPRPGSVIEPLISAARERRDFVALEGPRGALTFGEVDRRTEAIAAALRDRGIGRGAIVGLMSERSVEAILGALGILRSGAAYLPLDPSQPSQRLAVLVEDAKPGVILGRPVHRARLPAPETPWVDLAMDPEPAPRESSVEALRMPGPSDPAYVIYTSGSTGAPKGVIVSHHALRNHATAVSEAFGLRPEDRVLQFASPSFDVAAEEIFPTLTCGARVVVAWEGNPPAIANFVDSLRTHRVTVVNLPATYWHAWVDELEREPSLLPSSLRLVVVGSEVMRPDRLAAWKRVAGDRVRLINAYGPTEATITATTHEAAWEGDERNVAIGRPLAGVHVYVLDAARQAVPVGVPGEIHIGGAAVALGYLGRPDLTAARFVPDPFSDSPDARLYRTGDLGRWRPDGNLEFLGRLDDQVKVRGFRIEPIEIESALRGHPSVRDTAVLVSEAAGRRRLVAYWVPEPGGNGDSEDLRAFVQERLPEYMVPAAFVRLAALPRTPGGKLDRNALPAPTETESGATGAGVPPRTPAEKALVVIWAETLGRSNVGIRDNFFSLGGDSILSIQIVAQARRQGLRITTRQFFEHPTVEALAAAAENAGYAPTEQGLVKGEVPLTPIQRRFFEEDSPEPHYDNQSVLLSLREEPDVPSLEEAIRSLVVHHDALRHRFVRRDGAWTQTVSDPGEASPFSRVDLSRVAPGERPDALARACTEVQASLDLERGPVFRAVLFEGGPAASSRLLLVAHHLVVDGVSWRILLEDLLAAYGRLRRGSKPAPPPKTTSFRTWAMRLEEHARSSALLGELERWIRSGPRPARIPIDLGIETEHSTEGSARTVTRRLASEETRALLTDAPRNHDARINDVLLAALGLALTKWAGTGPWRIDLEGHGRVELFEGVDLSRTVGWFTTITPVLLDPGDPRDESNPGRAVDAVRRELRSIPNQGIGCGLLRHLGGPEVRSRLDAVTDAEISFNYLGQFDQALPAGSPFAMAEEPLGEMRSPRAKRWHVLDVTAFVSGGRFEVSWTYSASLHRADSIERLADSFQEELRALIRAPGRTRRRRRADEFPLVSLDDATVERILGDATDAEDILPLSPLQEGMLFHSVEESDPGAYVEQMAWTFEGALDTRAFEAAWQAVLERHPALRAGFAWEGLERPLQIVRRHAPAPWEHLDWRRLDAPERDVRLGEFLRAERGRGFDLGRPPLMRFALIRLDDAKHHFVWTHHHLLLDGWSVPLILEDLAVLYREARDGRPASLPAAPPYRDHLARLRTADPAEPQAFWRETLRGFRSATPIPNDRPGDDQHPGEILDDRYAAERIHLSEDATARLDAFARRHALTLGTIAQAAWGMLLSRYSGEEDVLFGNVAAGRSAEHPEAAATVGLFINTLPLRLRVPAQEHLLPWLREVQRGQFEILRYDQTSLVEAQGWSEIPPGRPLFESVFVFENFPMGARFFETMEALGVRDFQAWDKTNYPLSVSVSPGAGLSLQIIYDRRRFGPAFVRRMLGHMGTLLEAMPDRADRRLDELPMLTPEEKREALVQADGSSVPALDEEAGIPDRYPERCLHELVEEQAARRPDAVAVVLEQRSVTYRALDAMAQALAARLRSEGVGPEEAVAIGMDRSIEAIAGMLGVLKAGAAYVPLDPAYPADRLAFMLRDSGARVLLTQRRFRSRWPEHQGPVLVLDEPDFFAARADSGAKPEASGADRLAYIMYTSGSTGVPKGIEVTHRGIVRLVRNNDWARFGPDEVAPQIVSLSFDGSALEIWGCLLNGGRLVLHPSRNPSLEEIGEVLREGGVTWCLLITGVFSLMVEERLEDLRGLRQLIVGGDVMPPGAARRVLEAFPGLRLINAYGPTEGSVVASAQTFRSPSEIGTIVSIGRPLRSTQVYVLDRFRQPAPIGVPGEIFIGGDGLARGYHERPEWTEERFLPNPFRPGRLYRTGDIGRRLVDGRIEFLGRSDQQVKIRGFRIEPGEIEGVLSAHPRVDACAVIARETRGERRLSAFVLGGPEAPSPDELRAFLRAKLPDYMIPSTFVRLERFPLMPNGKIDRTALSGMDGERPQAAAIARPRTGTERLVATIWAEVLHRPDPGIDEGFFDTGGHSLLAMQLVSRLRSRLGPVVSLRDLYEAPTIRELGERLDAVSEPSRSPLR